MSHEKALEAGIEASGMGGWWDHIEERVVDFMRAYLDASGMVMVPREPTEEMIISGLNSDAWSEGKDSAVEMISETFKAMISAYPAPFKTPEESREKK